MTDLLFATIVDYHQFLGNLGSDLGKSVYINYLVSTEACFCVLKPPFCYRNGHCKELMVLV